MFRTFAKGTLASLGLLCAMLATQAQETATPPAPIIATSPGRAIHDPSIMKAGDAWYVFGSGGPTDGPQLPIRCSPDLRLWTPCGHVFETMPPWIRKRLPGVKDLWAPDISFVDGVYRIYYAYSILGKNTSGIALVTNKTLDRSSPDYAWVDQGSILETHAEDDHNAIDPNFLRVTAGKDAGDWLIFGSYWTGIKMRRLSPDGQLDPKDRKLYSLARRSRPEGVAPLPPNVPADWQAIEAPFAVHHGDFFYLFTSWDLCCRGPRSTYNVSVGRSKSLKGPYLDQGGKKLMQGGGTTVLSGNEHWAGPGGQSIWMGPADEDPHGLSRL